MYKEHTLEERFQKPQGWEWDTYRNARQESLRFGFLKAADPILAVANVIYIEGLSEYAEKTYELARDFNKAGCNFYVMERHGQGKHSRYLPDKFKVHAQDFQDDVNDLIDFAKKHVVTNDDKPTILIGHSTGGLIALMAQHDAQDMFEGTILTAPLFGVQNPLIKNKEHIMARTPLPRKIKESYIPGGGAWRLREKNIKGFKAADFTSDPVRMHVHDYWPFHDRTLRTGHPTMGWIREMCKALIKARNPAYLKEIKRPVRVYTAGKDILVNNKHTFEAIKNLPEVQHVHFKSGKHELPMETDDIRNRIIDESIQFIHNIRR